MALTVTLNGRPRTFPELDEGASLLDAIAALKLKVDRVAVERNGDIVRRAAWAQTPLHSGDRLEVVHFVGGGSAPR